MAIENKIEAFGAQFEDAYHVIKSIKWWKHDVDIHPPNIEPDNTICDVEMYSYTNKEARDALKEPISKQVFVCRDIDITKALWPQIYSELKKEEMFKSGKDV